MAKFLLTVAFVFSSIFYFRAQAEGMSKDEMDAYMKGCRHALRQAKTSYDGKDIEMLCSDPYLKGKPNESAADKARRMKLIQKTDEDKARFMKSWTRSEDVIKPCFDSILAAEPGKDLKDVKMLCLNPYLTPSEGESADDQARRKRLIKESEAAKEKALDRFVVPAGKATGTDGAAGAR